MPAQESEPAAPAQTSIIRENGYPNFEVILQGDDRESWESMVSSLPVGKRDSIRCSSEDVASRFSLTAGELGLKEGEWALDVSNYGVDLWLNPGDAVFDEEALAALVAEASGATWVGITDDDRMFLSGASFSGNADFTQYDDEENYLMIGVFRSSENSYKDNSSIVAEYEF